MRCPFVILAAVAAMLPAAAHAAEEAPPLSEEDTLVRAADAMRDPVRQQEVASMTESVIALMLEMPVGNLMQAAAEIAGEDPDSVDPHTTLREVAGPDAEDAPRRVAAAMPRMMESMGALAGALGTVLPELRRLGEDIARELPDSAE